MKKYLIVLLIFLQSDGCSQIVFDDPPVPVEFIRMTVLRSDVELFFEWLTASELNNDYFRLEESLEGNEWIVVGTITGNGTSRQLSRYTFNHVQPRNAFYKLFQVDYDGTEKQLTVVVVPGSERGNFMKLISYYDMQGRPVTEDEPGFKLRVSDVVTKIYRVK